MIFAVHLLSWNEPNLFKAKLHNHSLKWNYT